MLIVAAKNGLTCKPINEIIKLKYTLINEYHTVMKSNETEL